MEGYIGICWVFFCVFVLLDLLLNMNSRLFVLERLIGMAFW